jgi:hypothetical protein
MFAEMKSIASELAMYKLVTMVQDLQALRGADGEIQEGQERDTMLWLVLRKGPRIVPADDLEGIRTEGNQVP